MQKSRKKLSEKYLYLNETKHSGKNVDYMLFKSRGNINNELPEYQG